MDHEKFTNYASGIQSVALAIGVVVGGIWTYLTFDATSQVQKAQVELQKTQAELKALKEHRAVTVKIEPVQLHIPGDSSRYISAKVRLENIGNQAEIIYWSPDDFQVSRIWMEHGRALKAEPQRGIRLEEINGPGVGVGINLTPGGPTSRTFLARIDKPGLYYIRLAVRASPQAQNEAHNDGVANDSFITWGEETSLVIN